MHGGFGLGMGGFMVKDPVCGMEIEEKDSAGTSEYEGRTYYFCASGCKETFNKESEKYIKESEAKGTGCSCGL